MRAVHGTTAIEGNPLSEAEVQVQIERIEREAAASPTDKSREITQIANAVRGQDWVKDRFAPGSSPVSMGDILTMHKLLTESSDEVDNVPGALRNNPVRVGAPDLGGIHWGASHNDLPRMMEKLLKDGRAAQRLPVGGRRWTSE